MNLASKTVPELKQVAKARGIELPEGVKKAEIVAALEAKSDNVITAPKKVSNEATNVTNNPSGVTISPQPEHNRKKEIVPEPDPKTDPSKVAVFAQKNLSWAGVGRLDKGYNFVTKGVAEKWLTHRAVRSATPEEVANFYGVS